MLVAQIDKLPSMEIAAGRATTVKRRKKLQLFLPGNDVSTIYTIFEVRPRARRKTREFSTRIRNGALSLGKIRYTVRRFPATRFREKVRDTLSIIACNKFCIHVWQVFLPQFSYLQFFGSSMMDDVIGFVC